MNINNNTFFSGEIYMRLNSFQIAHEIMWSSKQSVHWEI